MNPMLDCLMPSFQVYLPPRLVDLSVCSAADVPITFRKIPRSLSAESLSQPRSQGGSLLGRLLLGHGTKIEQDRKGKRRATELDLEQNDLPEASRVGGDAAVGPVPGPLNDGVDRYPLMSPTQESPRPPKHDIHQDLASPTGDANNHNEASRRERKRLKAAELMAALPELQADDSILSLNTTMSNPSQVPPSGQDGNGDTSMYNLPRWTIPLSKLSTLGKLLDGHRGNASGSLDAKVHVIVCITSTTAPVLRRRKEERAKGQEGTLWIAKWDVIAPSEAGHTEVGCEVVLWDKCARDYGETVRRGDVVLLENVEFRPASKRDKAQLVLSTSFPTPRPVVLYRTMPRFTSAANYVRSSPRIRGYVQARASGKMTPEDRALRPDLRIGRSDPGIRRVAETVKWFADWVGGEGP